MKRFTFYSLYTRLVKYILRRTVQNANARRLFWSLESVPRRPFRRDAERPPYRAIMNWFMIRSQAGLAQELQELRARAKFSPVSAMAQELLQISAISTERS